MAYVFVGWVSLFSKMSSERDEEFKATGGLKRCFIRGVMSGMVHRKATSRNGKGRTEECGQRAAECVLVCVCVRVFECVCSGSVIRREREDGNWNEMMMGWDGMGWRYVRKQLLLPTLSIATSQQHGTWVPCLGDFNDCSTMTSTDSQHQRESNRFDTSIV
ncbi:hypothetical protein L249_6774 [Ophiocordyceps polyrhachis-furcata BCC 54312]|uniref:Uncharacterized protein n=1 Tax=Ophiocordyceps polyrhachis-furcata BCC 54312 TaxID=1330021 RepID=A0A367LLB2_9HYPO|nr:hypothetical protein L249_6774 [Ophiocordyceps polyrhachis-furcata BCC 54312]